MSIGRRFPDYFMYRGALEFWSDLQAWRGRRSYNRASMWKSVVGLVMGLAGGLLGTTSLYLSAVRDLDGDYLKALVVPIPILLVLGVLFVFAVRRIRKRA